MLACDIVETFADRQYFQMICHKIEVYNYCKQIKDRFVVTKYKTKPAK